MYLEIVFAFTLGLLPDAVVEKRWWVVAAVIAVLAVIAEGIVLTFTRAGLLTLTAGVLLVGAIRYRRGGFDTGDMGGRAHRASWSPSKLSRHGRPTCCDCG